MGDYLISYFIKKKIPFAVKENHLTGEKSIVGIRITKKDRFYRANGKIVPLNIAQYFL